MAATTQQQQTIMLVAEPKFLDNLLLAMNLVARAHTNMGILAKLDEAELRQHIAQHTRDSLPITANQAVARLADAALTNIDFEIDGKNLRELDRHIRAPHVRVDETDPYVAQLEWSTYVDERPVGCRATFNLNGDTTQTVTVDQVKYPAHE